MGTIRVAKRDHYTRVLNESIGDKRLSFRARGVLVWLLSKPDDWETNSELIAAEGTEGRDAIRTALRELAEHGYLRREKIRHADGRFETIQTFYERPEPGPGNPASVDQSSETQASTTNDCEQTTDDQGSSLRSEALSDQVLEEEPRAEDEPIRDEKFASRELATAYWDWHKAENGGPPAQDFKVLMSVAKACLKLEYPADEILAAMKLERRGMTKQKVVDRIGYLRRAAENRPATSAIPGEVVKAMTAARPWFSERWGEARGMPSWAVLCDVVAVQVRLGYGVGESMIRLAIAMREPARIGEAFRLSNMDVPRFQGGLADYPASMEAAYKNRGWKL